MDYMGSARPADYLSLGSARVRSPTKTTVQRFPDYQDPGFRGSELVASGFVLGRLQKGRPGKGWDYRSSTLTLKAHSNSFSAREITYPVVPTPLAGMPPSCASSGPTQGKVGSPKHLARRTRGLSPGEG